MIGPSAETLIKMGAKQTSLIVNQGEWYRLFSPMVLHAGLIHYFLNMMALWFIGKAVEQCHGFAAAAIIFVIPAGESVECGRSAVLFWSYYLCALN
jgi:membrane associated rhomboid family serine protease